MTASLLCLSHGRRDGESGEARRDRAAPGTRSCRPYGTRGAACIRRTARRGNACSHPRAALGAGKPPQGGLNAARGRRHPRFAGALRPPSRGSVGAFGAPSRVLVSWGSGRGDTGGICADVARRGPGFERRLPSPCERRPKSRDPVCSPTLGGRRERVNALRRVGRRGCGQACGHDPLTLWRTGGTPVDRLGRPCGSATTWSAGRGADQEECRAPGVDGNLHPWGQPPGTTRPGGGSRERMVEQ